VFLFKKTYLFASLMLIVGSFACIECTENTIDLETSTEPLFVSLGSFCGPASTIQTCGLRKAAFPFDWMLSVDGEKIIELLENGFLHFLDEEYLVPSNINGILLHTYYHMEFSHEGDWREMPYSQNFEKFKTKYERRVMRFKQLNNYHGKVIFVRAAWPLSDHPNYAFTHKGNIEISEEYSLRLNKALKKLFPNLKFELIIMNTHQVNDVESIKIIGNVLIVKSQSPDIRQLEKLIDQR
jgi:hypothetical protein